MPNIIIESTLSRVLLDDDTMHYWLYAFELEELVDRLIKEMSTDHNEYAFAITENDDDVAMLLIEKPEKVYINEQARDKLKELWLSDYESNIKQIIPYISNELKNGTITINYIK